MCATSNQSDIGVNVVQTFYKLQYIYYSTPWGEIQPPSSYVTGSDNTATVHQRPMSRISTPLPGTGLGAQILREEETSNQIGGSGTTSLSSLSRHNTTLAPTLTDKVNTCYMSYS